MKALNSKRSKVAKVRNFPVTVMKVGLSLVLCSSSLVFNQLLLKH